MATPVRTEYPPASVKVPGRDEKFDMVKNKWRIISEPDQLPPIQIQFWKKKTKNSSAQWCDLPMCVGDEGPCFATTQDPETFVLNKFILKKKYFVPKSCSNVIQEEYNKFGLFDTYSKLAAGWDQCLESSDDGEGEEESDEDEETQNDSESEELVIDDGKTDEGTTSSRGKKRKLADNVSETSTPAKRHTSRKSTSPSYSPPSKYQAMNNPDDSDNSRASLETHPRTQTSYKGRRTILRARRQKRKTNTEEDQEWGPEPSERPKKKTRAVSEARKQKAAARAKEVSIIYIYLYSILRTDII